MWFSRKNLQNLEARKFEIIRCLKNWAQLANSHLFQSLKWVYLCTYVRAIYKSSVRTARNKKSHFLSFNDCFCPIPRAETRVYTLTYYVGKHSLFLKDMLFNASVFIIRSTFRTTFCDVSYDNRHMCLQIKR